MQAGDIDQLDGSAAENDALRVLASVTMPENGEIDGAGWRILIRWNQIMKPATGHSRHATRGSTAASRRPHDKDLLPADLSGAHAETRER